MATQGETLGPWINYTGWLGAGHKILEQIGNALPDDYGNAQWTGASAGLGLPNKANQLRRLQCLTALGYSNQEIRALMSGTNFSTWSDALFSQYLGNFKGRIESGASSQVEEVAHCLAMSNQYGPFLFPPDVSGGRRLGPESTWTPPPTVEPPPPPETQPPTVITTPRVPFPGGTPTGPISTYPTPAPGPDPSATPVPGQGSVPGRDIDYPSMLSALLTIWQRWQQWRNRQQQTGWQIDIQMPGWPQWGGYPGIPGTVRPAPGTGQGGAGMYVNTSLLGGGEGGSWGGLLGQALNTASQIWGPNQARPGGAAISFQMPSLDMPFMDIVPQGQGAACSGLTSPFAPSGGRGARAKIHVQIDPISGRPVWFRPAGRPILWSSDLSACKRVRKVASRARRARGGR
jgi:hypothetical protein